MAVKLVINSKSRLGEGPSWDADKELLYWVDILGKKVHRYDPAKHENNTVELSQAPGTIAPRETGEVILAMENGFYFYNWISEELEPIDDPEKHLPYNRFNDGKCDPAGRFWAGTTDEEGINGNGALYCLDVDLNVEKKVSGVSTSNGIAWSPDFSSMYYIDTPTMQVVRYSYYVKTGEIKNPEVVISFKDEEGIPDGMTIDEEGMLWIAHWGGGKVSRWNPETGDKIEEIPVPAVNVTSCVFGGKHRNELFITTARTGTSNGDLEKFPYSGGLFKVKTDVKGTISYPFKG